MTNCDEESPVLVCCGEIQKLEIKNSGEDYAVITIIEA